MSTQSYLIDTNVIIGLEDNFSVHPAFADFLSTASKYKVDVFVHEAAKDDIVRDKDTRRQAIQLSKLAKFQVLGKVRGIDKTELEKQFGPLSKPNDIVDATLLHALTIGVSDFLVTQDRGLHNRARRYSAELGGRVLYVPDAVQLLKTTFEPIEAPVRYVEEVAAHTIPLTDTIFDSLRNDYPSFDEWWTDKCVKGRRSCWVVSDNGIAGIIVRKEEKPDKTDATLSATKILKLCTFKVCAEKRGFKLGELLLKKVFWYAQANKYDLVYITTFPNQVALIDLLEYYGFVHTKTKEDGELIFEKTFSQKKLLTDASVSLFESNRLNYPRFATGPDIKCFGVPIKEHYHDMLYPDLKNDPQSDLFESAGLLGGPKRVGNTIRKVYLCRAQSKLDSPGSILLFYKGKSYNRPSQALTAVGILESVASAYSTKDLMHMTGGRSVYSETQLNEWHASIDKPVKVINYLLVGYIEPPIAISDLKKMKVFEKHPAQSIWSIPSDLAGKLLKQINLGFEV